VKIGSHVKVAFVLGIAGGLSVLAVLPYLLEITPGARERLASLPLPLPILLAFQCAQAAVLMGLLSWAGLRLGAPLGLDAPWLRRWVERGRDTQRPASSWRWAIVIGLAVGAAVLLLDLAFRPWMPAPLHPLPAGIDRWKTLAASFYGGIGEEVQVRLFLMTLIAWIGARIARRTSSGVYWTAIVLAALLFGAGHLPTAFGIFGTGAVNVIRTLLLNGIAGVAFGWLFWRRGLEHAIVAHFSADLVVHVITGG